jgi:protein tyrosine phosphatase (PTP) superfamily phosphohydrolase (DUF442 family)
VTTNLNDIQNFLAISEQLGTAGQPFREQFAALRETGYQVVINLAMPDSWDAVAGEPELCHALGLEHFHIPVVWEAPRPEDLRQFCDLMDALGAKKVFVHCARNMRVSAFVYLYRLLRRGEPPERCQQDLQKIWQPNETWQNFIDSQLEQD